MPLRPRFSTLARPRQPTPIGGPDAGPVAPDPGLTIGDPLVRSAAWTPPPKRNGAALMTTATWITMIAVMAFVWGGLAMALRAAIRKESAKSAN